MNKLMHVCLVTMMAAASVMAAGEPVSKEKQMESLGVQRGRLMLKMDDVRKLMDGNLNGATAAQRTIQGIQGKRGQVLAKQLQEENAKTAEAKNQAVLEDLQKKTRQNNEMWSQFSETEWAAYNKAAGEQYPVFQALSQSFASVVNIEMTWNNAGLDLDTLTAVLSAMEKRADDIKAKVAAPLAKV
ncbi:MAG: hypothetical protein WCG36_10815, partial [bacterium]